MTKDLAVRFAVYLRQTPGGSEIVHVDSGDDGPEECSTARPEPFDSDGYPCFIIEYTDSKGQRSIRRVGVHRREGHAILCYCFERRAIRKFRLDRISAMFDLDGELLEPAPFTIGQDATHDAPAVPQPLHVALRKTVMPEAIVLRGIALCDGRVDRRENGVLVDFIYRRMVGHGLPDDAEHRQQVAKWLRNFYPNPTMLDGTIASLARQTPQEAIDLLRACRDVIKADGKVHPAEVQRFEQFGAALVEYRRQVANEGIAVEGKRA